MPKLPHLSHRAITAYNCLAGEVAALNYLIRFAKPAGTLGLYGRQRLDSAMRIANRLYRREAGMPSFGRIDAREPLTAADVTLMVTRLTVASNLFEERYAHLTADGRAKAAAAAVASSYARDGLPSPHA